MDLVYLVAYVALLVLAYVRARSAAWLVVTVAAVGSLAGVLIALVLDMGHRFDRPQLQAILLGVFVVVSLLAWLRPLGFSISAPGNALGAAMGSPVRRQALLLWLPMAVILLGFIVMSTWWTAEPAFLRPVSFLIGHGDAEDNAKWLDFASQFASGDSISQGVPMGGPLQLLLTFVGTVMGVVSSVTFGGYNQVAVAANTIIYAEFAMVALVLVALAPFVESRVRGNRLPGPAIWAGMLVLASATLALVGFGHLTLQFTILVAALWSAVFLGGLQMRRARLLTSLVVAAALTVWLPLNVVAVLILGGWLVVLIARGLRGGRSAWDWVGIGLLVVWCIALAKPIYSSLVYSFAISAGEPLGGAVHGVVAAVRAGLTESPVFSAQGGTEQVGPILAIFAAAAVLAAAIYLRPAAGPVPTSLLRRFVPIGLLGLAAAGIYSLDFWSTGDGPHYGSLKFTFLVAIVALATCLPIALMLIDAPAGGMTQVRWLAIGGVVVLLMVDSLLPRAIALVRPEQWSPPIPFDNTSGSYWYPADVNGSADQPIASNPVACVYLPEGSAFPTAIVPSGLSDAQRVYSCTRQLAGLSGSDTSALPLVEWIRREWYTNTPAWTDVYDSLAQMPANVLAKPVILLDDGSNVIGVESVQSLLQRFPKPVS